MKTENLVKPKSGLVGLVVFLGAMLVPFTFQGMLDPIAFWIGYVILGICAFIWLAGMLVVNPNQSAVLTLFGTYVGVVKENGFYHTNPFYSRKLISLRARNFESERMKVNDKLGNPILISTILVWNVVDTYKAAFDVDHYEQFVKVQCDAALRHLAGTYPYDDFDENISNEVTLRSGMQEVNDALEQELKERLFIAGIGVMEARIGYLAYAEEIAQAMLKRQQATAVVAARTKIVEGAVGMVEKALETLSARNIIELDDERKAAMVSNLLVVLCSDKETTPVVNTGTLNH